MNKTWLIAATIGLSSCTLVQSISRDSTLILKPQILSATQTQAAVPVYSQSSIHHLKLVLFNLTAGDVATGIERTLLNAQLGNPVVFANLKANTSYRVRAYAYLTSDDSQLISNVNSYLDIQLVTDDRPTIGTLNVSLIDRAFNGQASASLAVNPGGYVPLGSETFRLEGLEGIVTAIAGSGSLGMADGIGTQAMFNQPCNIAIDDAGVLFVVDRVNNRIRKVTPAGVVTTFAGNGSSIALDGTGTNASLKDPYGIAMDQIGNLYVTEATGNRIRKITKDAVVTTFVGSGEKESLDGTGTAAKLCYPHGITISPGGDIYFAEAWGGSHRIRKATPAGVVSTVAGGTASGWSDGTGTTAVFFNPCGLIFDPSGNLYITDNATHRIRRMSPSGVVTTLAGSGFPGSRDGQGTNAQFDLPAQLAMDKAQNLYVGGGGTYADYRIRKITPSGWVSTVAGMGSGYQNGTGFNVRFNLIDGMAMDATGDLYLSDRGNHRIRRVR